MTTPIPADELALLRARAAMPDYDWPTDTVQRLFSHIYALEERIAALEEAAAGWAWRGRHLDDCALKHGSWCSCGMADLHRLLPKPD